MFFPQQTETLVSPIDKSEVINRIESDLKPVIIEGEENPKTWFKGVAQNDAFEISLILKRPNNFTPIISGIIEPDEGGKTLILVKYRLFPSSKRFLLFWTVLTLLIALFFAIPYHAYWYAAISFAAGLVNYIITKENFRIQVRKSRRALMSLIK